MEYKNGIQMFTISQLRARVRINIYFVTKQKTNYGLKFKTHANLNAF